MNKKNISVIGAGLSCIDLIKGDNFQKTMLGGTATNVISVLALLGYDTEFLIAKYSGTSGEYLDNELRGRGIELRKFIDTKKVAPMIIETFDYEMGQHMFVTTCPVCNEKLCDVVLPTGTQIQKILSKKQKKYALFFYDRISEGIHRVIDNSKASWKFYEPNSFRIYSTFIKNAKRANVLKLSQEKLPKSFEERIIGDLQDSEIAIIIISMGKAGVKFSIRNEMGQLQEWVHVEGVQKESIVDSSGAGDWTSAIFIHKLLDKYPVPTLFDRNDVISYLEVAQTVAGITCGYIGAQGVLQSKDAVEQIETILECKLIIPNENPFYPEGKCEFCHREKKYKNHEKDEKKDIFR